MTKLHAMVFLLLFIHTNAFPGTRVPTASAAGPSALGQTTGGTIGQTTPTGATIGSWLTDTIFQRMDAVYDSEFQVLTKGSRVVTTNPGGFYYNVLVTALADIPDLSISVSLPEDFALWGDNPVHAWVDGFDTAAPDDETAVYAGDSLTAGPFFVAAGSQVFMTVHVRYSLADLPSDTYLPKVYTFSATAWGTGVSLATSASMTGVRKK